MSLKDALNAELARKQAAEQAARAHYEEAKARLTAFYRDIRADRELLDMLHSEVELYDDELKIDPGPILITVAVTPEGNFTLNYEVKRADDYRLTEVPVRSIEDIEQAVAKLIVEHAHR